MRIQDTALKIRRYFGINPYTVRILSVYRLWLQDSWKVGER